MTKKILIVDDEPDVVDFFSEFLGMELGEIEIKTAECGEQALENFSHDIDLVVTDLRMPGVSGSKLARQLRNRKSSVKIVLITGYLDRSEIMECVDLELFDEIYEKPIDTETVATRIKTLLAA